MVVSLLAFVDELPPRLDPSTIVLPVRLLEAGLLGGMLVVGVRFRIECGSEED